MMSLNLSKPFPSLSFTENESRFLIYLGFFLGIYLFPILIADFYHQDDWGRALTGPSWDGLHRWGQTAFYRFLYPIKLLDLAPFPQMLGGVFLLISGFLVYKRLFASIPPFFASIIAFLFLANPYFLENLSFRFDAAGMSLAFLLNVWAFYLVSGSGRLKFTIAAFLITFSLIVYQIGFVIFVGLVAIYFVERTASEDKDVKNLWIWLLKCALIVSIPAAVAIISMKLNAANHLYNAYGGVNVDIKSKLHNFTPFIKNPILASCFLIPFLLTSLAYIYYSIRYKINALTKLIVLTLPISIIIIGFSDILFMAGSNYRTHYGFSLIALFTFLYGYFFLERLGLLRLSLLFLLPVLYLTTNSYAHARFQKSANQDAVNISYFLANDLQSLGKENENLIFVSDGEFPLSQRSFRLRSNLLFPYGQSTTSSFIFSETLSASTSGYLRYQRRSSNIENFYIKDFAKIMKSEPVIKENNLYTMKIKDNIVLIKFKEQPYLTMSRGVLYRADKYGKKLRELEP